MVASFRCSGCASVLLLHLLLHLLALLLAIVVNVVVNLSAVCTSDVAVIVIVTVMYPLSMLPVHCRLMAVASGRSPHGEDPVAVGVIFTMSAPFAYCPSVLLFVAVAAVIAAAASSLLLVYCCLLPGCC